MQEHNEVSALRRRRHSAAFKAEAVNACRQPGVSVAAVALQYRLNANLLRRWVAQAQANQTVSPSDSALVTPPAEFIPLRLAPETATATDAIVIEVKRGTATVTIRWPGAVAAECAHWLQGWLR